MNSDSLATRITELETRLEFQDETIARLNDALVVQQQKYFDLDRTMKLLIERMNDKPIDAGDPRDEPPPPQVFPATHPSR